MASGPSKQDLEMYWQSSRQYFDELAAYYKQADPEYYRTYMEPFYTNPLNSVSNSGSKGGSGAAKLLIVLVVFFLILGIGGVAAYFVISKYSTEETESIDVPFKKDKKSDQKDKSVTKEKDDTKIPESDDSNKDDETSLSSDDHFIIGSKKIGEKEYDKAEYHLKQVKPGTQYYEQSKQLLESLKFLRKYDK
jgi:hypothetical protein